MSFASSPVGVAETRLTHAVDELIWAARFVRTEVTALATDGVCFEQPLAVRIPALCTAAGQTLAWLERFCALAGLKDDLWQQTSAAYRKAKAELPPLPPEYRKGD